MEIKTPADAFAAIAVAVVGVDGIGTMEEGAYLAGEMRSLSVFEGMGTDEYMALLRSTSADVWTSLPNDGKRITEAGLTELITACRGILDPELCVQACHMAESIADADFRTHEEHGVILSLKAGFDLPQA